MPAEPSIKVEDRRAENIHKARGAKTKPRRSNIMPREDLPARYRRWTYKKTFLWQPKKARQQRTGRANRRQKAERKIIQKRNSNRNNMRPHKNLYNS